MHQGQVTAEVLGVALRDLHAAGVGRHDDEVLGLGVGLEILLEHRGGGEVVHWHVEETLDLTGVQVDRQHTIGAGGLQHVGEQLRGNRFASS